MQMSLKTTKRLLVATFFACAGFYALVGSPADARTSGTGFGQRTSAPAFGATAAEMTCTACHNPATSGPINSPGGLFTVSTPADTYAPGTDITVTVRLARNGVSKFGFQLQALDDTGQKAGEITLTDATRTQVQIINTRQYISHNGAAGTTTTTPGDTNWTFKWTPPATAVGRVVFYAAGNATNNSSSNAGDFVYNTTKALYASGFTPQTIAAVSAASYAPLAASESIMALFGANLTPSTVVASAIPLPTTLGGVRVVVHDLTTHIERDAPLFYVSAGQINFQIPMGVTNGMARVNVLRDNTAIGSNDITVTTTAPALFTFNADSSGVPAGFAARFRGDATLPSTEIAQFVSNRWEPLAINLGAADERVFLVAYGTGFRGRMTATATIGGTTADVMTAAQGQLVGLDQANILIPRSLIGRGLVDVILTIDGRATNTVRINVQ